MYAFMQYLYTTLKTHHDISKQDRKDLSKLQLIVFVRLPYLSHAMLSGSFWHVCLTHLLTFFAAF